MYPWSYSTPGTQHPYCARCGRFRAASEAHLALRTLLSRKKDGVPKIPLPEVALPKKQAPSSGGHFGALVEKAVRGDGFLEPPGPAHDVHFYPVQTQFLNFVYLWMLFVMFWRAT